MPCPTFFRLEAPEQYRAGCHVAPHTVKRLLDERYGQLDTTAAQVILRDHANEPDSICRHEDELGDPEGKRLQSVFCLVMSLEEQSVQVTDGPPCSSAFAGFSGRLTAAAVG
jgi:hypothetical protein